MEIALCKENSVGAEEGVFAGTEVTVLRYREGRGGGVMFVIIIERFVKLWRVRPKRGIWVSRLIPFICGFKLLMQ